MTESVGFPDVPTIESSVPSPTFCELSLHAHSPPAPPFAENRRARIASPRRSAAMPTFAVALALALLLLDAGCRVARRTRACGSTLLLAGAVLGASWLLLWQLLLGALGWLTPPLIWLGVALGWIGSRVVTRRSPLPGIAGRLRVLLRGELPVWLALSACVLVLLEGLRAPRHEYDAVSYHLPYTLAALEQGASVHVDTPFGDPSAAYQPKNDALLRTALVPFADTRLLEISAWPCLLLLLLSCYVLARALGCGRRAALWGALVPLGSILVLGQARSAMVDLPFATWWAAFAALAAHPLLARHTVPAGFALGLGYGAKFLALPFTPIALLFALRRPRAFVVLLVGALLTGAWFYLRNLLWTGNPIYPIEASLLGIDLFPGPITTDRLRDWIFHLWNHLPPGDVWALLLGQVFGLPSLGDPLANAPLAWIVPPLLVAFGLWRSRHEARAWSCLLALLWLIVTCVWILPFQDPRFLILAPVFVAALSARAGPWLAPPLIAVQLALCHGPRTAPLLVTALALSGFLLWRFLPRRFAGRADGALLAVVLALPFAWLLREPRPEGPVQPLGAAIQFLASQENSEPVAYAGCNVPFVLRGPHHRPVRYVPLDGTNARFDERAAAWLRDGLPRPIVSEAGLHRRLQDPRAWFRALRRERIGWLAVARLRDQQLLSTRHDSSGFPIEAQWAAAMAPAFTRVFEDAEVRIWRLQFDQDPGEWPPAAEQRESDALQLLHDALTAQAQTESSGGGALRNALTLATSGGRILLSSLLTHGPPAEQIVLGALAPHYPLAAQELRKPCYRLPLVQPAR
jgi:hypothetical protein